MNLFYLFPNVQCVFHYTRPSTTPGQELPGDTVEMSIMHQPVNTQKPMHYLHYALWDLEWVRNELNHQLCQCPNLCII